MGQNNYYNYNEKPHNSIGIYLGPYINPFVLCACVLVSVASVGCRLQIGALSLGGPFDLVSLLSVP